MPKSNRPIVPSASSDQISRVRIGVVEAVVEDHFEVHLGAVAGDQREIELRFVRESRIGEPPAVEPLHREHALRGELGVAARDADVRVAAEVAGELVEVAGLAGEVELAADDAAEFGDHRLRPVGRELGQHLGELGETGQDVEVDVHAALDAGVLHFHDDIGAAAASARRDGPGRSTPRRAAWCRSRRTALRAARRARFRSSADGLGIVGGHVGLQLLQLVGERHADLVGPRAEDLAELDERGAELFDGQADARFAAEMGERFAVAVLEDALHDGQIEAADPAGEAVLAEDREDLAPAIDVAIDLGDGGDFHARGRRTLLRLLADGFQGLLGEARQAGLHALGGRGERGGGRLGGGPDFAECPGGPFADRQIGVALENFDQFGDGARGARSGAAHQRDRPIGDVARTIVGQGGERLDLVGGGRAELFERGGTGFEDLFVRDADGADQRDGGGLRGVAEFGELGGGGGLRGGVGAFELGDESLRCRRSWRTFTLWGQVGRRRAPSAGRARRRAPRCGSRRRESCSLRPAFRAAAR